MSQSASRSRLNTVRDSVSAVVGAVLGVLPHLLHHIGLVAGTAFVAGLGGNLLFYVVGLVLSVPMLRRIHQRFRTWVAPATALGVFTALFALSALVVGPALTGESDPPEQSTVPTSVPTGDHTEHHT